MGWTVRDFLFASAVAIVCALVTVVSHADPEGIAPECRVEQERCA